MAKDQFDEFEDEEFDEFDDEIEEKPKKKEKKADKVQLPLMLELVYSFSLIFTIVLAFVVAVLSFMSGAEWLDVFVRTAITILTTGLLLWIFSAMVSNGAVKTLKALQEEASDSNQQQRYKMGNNLDGFSEMNDTDVEESEE